MEKINTQINSKENFLSQNGKYTHTQIIPIPRERRVHENKLSLPHQTHKTAIELNRQAYKDAQVFDAVSHSSLHSFYQGSLNGKPRVLTLH